MAVTARPPTVGGRPLNEVLDPGMNPFRTSFRTAEQTLTLPLSRVDLRNQMKHEFSLALGTFENHSVARGQDTEAWVSRSRGYLKREIDRFREKCKDPSRNLIRYITALESFLDTSDSETVEIRHHYAWWYPKWFDRLMA